MSYLDLAAATHIEWSSGNNPLPIGVGKNGKQFDWTNSAISPSALE